MNRDTEVLKIQIYVGYCHSTSRVRISFVLSAFVAILVSLMGLSFQKAIDTVTYYVLIVSSTLFFLYYMQTGYRDYKEKLGKVDKMIESVDNGNSLPSVEDIIKGKGV